jgi:hypothetical protein
MLAPAPKGDQSQHNAGTAAGSAARYSNAVLVIGQYQAKQHTHQQLHLSATEGSAPTAEAAPSVLKE